MYDVTNRDVDIAKAILISSYPTTVPTFCLWTGVLGRIMVQKEKARFWPLIVISILMIVSQIASMLYWQL
jgi:hypothetical protein